MRDGRGQQNAKGVVWKRNCVHCTLKSGVVQAICVFYAVHLIVFQVPSREAETPGPGGGMADALA